ncbi:MAG: GNAT family N-acetyltransferase [Sinomonas sp.]|nr:GNAT family N-acetyltransferase [Sinomonas sp.]
MGWDTARRAAPGEAVVVAELLDAFNREFETPTPGISVLAERLVGLLAGGDVVALLVGEPAVGVALITLRPNVWFEGPVALLDELYVAPSHARRFYERHGYSNREPGQTEAQLYYFKELRASGG